MDIVKRSKYTQKKSHDNLIAGATLYEGVVYLKRGFCYSKSITICQGKKGIE